MSFDLALAMGLPREQLMASMTESEFVEWMAYSCIRPIGPQANEILTARICCAIANSMGGKKGGGAFTEADFMPDIEQHEQTVEEQQMRIRHSAKAGK